ncbi:MAG: LicD family protein [Eubacterium sp.]|nr:LicD family protein [Eubacterium sp.]
MMNEHQQRVVDKIHDYEYEMMCKFDDVCRKYDITYYLEGGTLIGAARHKDFVPWDDDIDIYIKRADFEKLLEHKYEFEPYFIHVPNGDENCFWDFTSRIMYDKVLFKKNDKEAMFYKHIHCQYLFFDFFIMDNFPGGFRGKLMVFKLKMLYALAMSRRYKLQYDKPKNPIARFGISAIAHIGMFFPMKHLYKTYDKISKRYNKKDNCEDYILSNASASFLSDCIYKKEWYKTRAELPIRDRKFFVPGDYDSSLRHYYGDYMQLPPEEDRMPIHVDEFDDVMFEGVSAKDI